MKGKFITLVLTLGFLAAFGVFMHSPPSILDGLTGATPKAKRAAQMAAPLEGNYLFCINPALEPFSDADFRNDLKAFVSGETEVLSDAGLPHMTLSVCETDYPLLCYATALCERLTAAGADVTLKQYSETMLRSRAINGRYDDELDLRNFGGQKKKRTAFAQSDTGKQLMTALIDAVRREESAGTVERFPHHKFRTLLLSGNICGGCTVQDTYTGELLRFVCDAVLIATGGLHGLFGDTTGSLANTGEVTAELFRLGVPMANLEMIQYHPTTVELGEKRMLLSEAARGEGGRLFALRNGKPWYFMEEKYPELGNLMPRDITAREVWTVSRDYEVFLDMTELPKEVMEHKLAGLVDDCQTYLHKDIRKEPIPILPGIHYFMGGIQVDERHRTSMRNLYAAGECCAQYHGANRLGGNSLLGAIYGGQIAAETACRETVSSPNMPCAEESLLPELSPDAQMQMNRILLNALGVVRDAQTLEAGIQEIRKLSGTLPLLGCAMLESALARKESRGAHWRADYPQRNDAVYCKTTVAHWNGQHIAISFESIPERRHDL